MSTKEWQAGYDAGYAAGLAAATGAAETSAAEPTADEPYVLGVTSEAGEERHGPYARITDAIDARDLLDVESGAIAVVYDRQTVAWYRGNTARFKYGRTQWNRA